MPWTKNYQVPTTPPILVTPSNTLLEKMSNDAGGSSSDDSTKTVNRNVGNEDSVNNGQRQRRSRVSIDPSGTSNSVYRVGIRIPPFWPEEPEIWFAQIEGQFEISKITSDSTKFYYVLGQLEPKYSAEVKDIIVNPPAVDKYIKLKTELIKRLSVSQEKKVKQLLMHEELGDRRPSQFLRHLQSLAGNNVPDDFIKTIWTSRLPNATQTILACQPSSAKLDFLSEMADKVHDIAPSSPQVAAASTSKTETTLETMARQISELTKQVSALTAKVEHQSRPADRHRAPRRKRSGSTSTRSQSSYRQYPTCWYHSKFGSKASKCIRPCDFKAENSPGSR